MKQRITGIALSLLAGAGLAFGSTEHHVVRHAKGHAAAKTAVPTHAAASHTVVRRVVVHGHVRYVRRSLVNSS